MRSLTVGSWCVSAGGSGGGSEVEDWPPDRHAAQHCAAAHRRGRTADLQPGSDTCSALMHAALHHPPPPHCHLCRSSGVLRLNHEVVSRSLEGVPTSVQLLPRQTYLNVDEDAAGTLERKRNYIYCLVVHIMKQEKEMHIDNLVFKVRGRLFGPSWTPRNWSLIRVLWVPSRSWTRARNRRPLALRAPAASAAAPVMFSPASCTSSAKAACGATRTTRTSWSSCPRTRPHHKRARPSSRSAAPRSGRTPPTASQTSGVSVTSDPHTVLFLFFFISPADSRSLHHHHYHPCASPAA